MAPPAPVSMPAAAGSGHTERFLSSNVRSLFNKIEEVELLLKHHEPLFFAVQETWCLQGEPDALYHINGYTMHRRDRPGRSGGGISIYVNNRKAATAQREPALESNDHEDLWLQLTINSTQQRLLVCTVYRPPNTAIAPFASALEQSLVGARRRFGAMPVIITGDFNARNSVWYSEDSTDELGDSLHQLFCSTGLRQLCSFPTNIYAGQLRSCIDLVASNILDLTVSTLPPLGNSDHVTVAGKFCCSATSVPAHRTIWCWSKADVKGLQSAVKEADWTEVLSSADVNAAWTMWKDQLLQIAHTYIPQRTVRELPRPRPWVTPDVAREVKLKHRLFHQYKRHPTPSNWSAYTRQRNKATFAVRRAKSTFVLRPATEPSEAAPVEERVPENQRATDLPRLHRLLRCFLKQKSCHVPTLLVKDDRQVISDTAKADVLNQFFVQQSSLSSGPGAVPLHSPLPDASPDDILTEFHIARSAVRSALQSLDVGKAAGGDGLPARLLRLVAEEITDCVYHIFHLSLVTASLPDEWRQATVIPIYKNRGSRQSSSNYRPISLLSVLSKVLERLIFDQLYAHLSPFLPDTQSGFRKKDNTTLQLARLVHTIASALDSNQYVFSCYFDISKAFDRVWHDGLLSKLHRLRIRGSAFDWLTAYLTSRSQRVRVGQAYSTWLPVPAGVPQGSVLGPLLFITYTADLPATLTDPNTRCDLFADDTSLTSICDTAAVTAHALQVSVDCAGQWLTNWRLTLDREKTVVTEYTRRSLPSTFTTTLAETVLTKDTSHRHPGVVPQADLDPAETVLKRATSHRHLGVVLQADLRWTAHVNHMLGKAGGLLHTLARLRGHLSTKALSLFYKAYIRPVLEYADVCWSPLPAHLRDRMERFQRRAAKLILRKPLFEPFPHDELLSLLNWHSLETRRNVHQALLAHRMATGKVPPHLSAYAFPSRTYTYPLRHTERFSTPIPHALYFSRSPLFHSATIFNQLPPSLQNEECPEKFKAGVMAKLLKVHCPCSHHVR